MKIDPHDYTFWLMIALIIGLGAGFIIGVLAEREVWHKAAISHGYAQYDPQSGVLKWKDGEDVP